MGFVDTSDMYGGVGGGSSERDSRKVCNMALKSHMGGKALDRVGTKSRRIRFEEDS